MNFKTVESFTEDYDSMSLVSIYYGIKIIRYMIEHLVTSPTLFSLRDRVAALDSDYDGDIGSMY